MVEAIHLLAAFGAILSLTYIYRFANFIWIYCLRPSSVHKYLHGTNPYAIVTGASDGIGKALAIELYDRGFNLILHGRNEEKTRKVVEEIRGRAGGKDVKYFLADGGDPEQDFGKIVQGFKGLNITLVVNNVGATPKCLERLDGWAEKDVLRIVQLNAIFPLLFTRALLPGLRARQGPVLVIFVGSISADIPIARFGLYASSKNFVESLARCLDADEHWPTKSPNSLSFMYLAVGKVVSNTMRIAPGIFTPTSERFAKAIVARIGCGRKRVTPWMPHAFLQWFMTMLGENIVGMFMRKQLSKILKDADKKID